MDTNKIKSLLEGVKDGTKTEDEVNKEIMSDYGKALKIEQDKSTSIQTKLDSANQKITTYETEIKNLKESSKDSDEWKQKFEELDKKVKEDEELDKKKSEDKTLTDNILNVFGDKKFINDRTKNSLIVDIKNELSKEENKGKGISDIFTTLTKDSTDIFASENQVVDMANMGDVDGNETSKNIKPEVKFNPIFKNFNN